MGLTLGAFAPLLTAFLTDLLPAHSRGKLIFSTIALAFLGGPAGVFLIRLSAADGRHAGAEGLQAPGPLLYVGLSTFGTVLGTLLAAFVIDRVDRRWSLATYVLVMLDSPGAAQRVGESLSANR
jgi:MFS family permease